MADEVEDIVDFTMVEKFYVDIPQLFNGEPTDEWRKVGTFDTKQEAIDYAREHFGADEDGNVCLVSQS